MGREIRRVPVDWEHPRRDCPHSPWAGGCDDAKRNGGKCYQPLFDKDAETAMFEWLEDYEEWKKGGLAEAIKEHPKYEYKLDEPYRSFCDWGGQPPDPEYFRPSWPEGAVLGYAVYETVSEGTPVTPTFATKEELVNYLATEGTFWDDGPWSREGAESFVQHEWAPSLMAIGGQLFKPGDVGMYPPRNPEENG